MNGERTADATATASRTGVTLRAYHDGTDRSAVIALWSTLLHYKSAHNAPSVSIDLKLKEDDGLFFVAVAGREVVGTVMAGYDGHRGWIYSLAVAPERQRTGIGRALVARAEGALRERGCVKVNLQIGETNAGVVGFYEKLGFAVEPRISMGKRLV